MDDIQKQNLQINVGEKEQTRADEQPKQTIEGEKEKNKIRKLIRSEQNVKSIESSQNLFAQIQNSIDDIEIVYGDDMNPDDYEDFEKIPMINYFVPLDEHIRGEWYVIFMNYSKLNNFYD